MKFTAPAKTIISAMKDIIGVIPNQSTLPILRCVHISSNSDKVRIRGTNLEIDIAINLLTFIPGTVEEGECCVDGRKLVEILSNISGDVTLSFSGKKTQMIITYKNGEVRLATIDASEFPSERVAKAGKTITLPGSSIRQAYDLVKNNVSKDQARPILQSVYLKVNKDNVELCATNGYTLSIAKINNEYTGDAIEPVIVSEKFFGLTSNTSEKTEIGFGDGCISYKDSWKEVYSTLISGNFPNVTGVIPKSTKFGVLVNTSELVSTLKRSTSIAIKGINLIGIIFGNKSIEVVADQDEVGSFSEKVDCEYVTATQTFERINFSASYLLGAITPLLNRGTEKIEIFFSSETSPARIDAPNFIGVVMPMHKI